MSKKRKSEKKMTTKDIIELLIEAVTALAALIAAIKSQVANPQKRKGAKAPSSSLTSQHIVKYKAMKNLKRATWVLAILMVLACVHGWSLAWKLIVEVYSALLLVAIAHEVWHRQNLKQLT